jgi:hypothetical protein
MNKKFVISWIAVFIVWMAGSFTVHGVWLSDLYGTMPNIMRTEEDSQALFHFMLLSHVVMAGAFTWIYQRGAEDKPWAQQGLRFGIAIALLAPVPMFTIYYVVQQIPAELAIRQAIGDGLVVIVAALVAAFLNRSESSEQSE